MKWLLVSPWLALAVAGPLQQIPLIQHEAEDLKTVAASWLAQSPAMLAHIESLPEPRLVRYEEGGQLRTRLITEGQKALLTLNGIRYMDVTDELDLTLDFKEAPEVPKTLAYSKKDLKPAFDLISTKRMRSFLTEFSGFRTRYYRSEDGKKSQRWLLSQIQTAIAGRKDMSVKEFPHPWGQSSIILRLERDQSHSNVKKHEDGVVILSAHQDSTNLLPFLPAPGADDDGSGTTTIIEVLHALVETEFKPSNSSIEWHFYSAEEGGLLGSQAVAQAYHQAGTKVKAMLQMDMTAYVKPGTNERIGLISDFVDPELTDFLYKLVDEYLDIPAVTTKCGYACSDHASWGKTGVRSAFSIEATFEDSNTGHIHTTGDKITVDGFSFEHMAQFAKLGISFLKELSS